VLEVKVPSRRKVLTGKAMERRIAWGFGQGEGADYLPWLRISDVPSKGTCTIITGWGNGREHHLLSRIERNYFYCLEWADDVIDIREQFPLLPLQRTLQIAHSLGIRHPSVRGEPIIMTIDFLLTVRTGDGLRYVARTVKPEHELGRKRVLEKFEIERRFFAEKGVDWGVITEKDIPEAVWRNIDWFHECRDANKLKPITGDEISRVCDWLISQIAQKQFIIMAELCKLCDAHLAYLPGTALKVMRHLLANKVIRIDITKRLRTDIPVRMRVEGRQDE
jgi:TnsA endonuclease N terminal/TnsA endonuclease C terminal